MTSDKRSATASTRVPAAREVHSAAAERRRFHQPRCLILRDTGTEDASLEATRKNGPGDVLRRTWSLSAIDVATDTLLGFALPRRRPLALWDQRPRSPRLHHHAADADHGDAAGGERAGAARHAGRSAQCAALRIEAASSRISERSPFAAASGSTYRFKTRLAGRADRHSPRSTEPRISFSPVSSFMIVRFPLQEISAPYSRGLAARRLGSVKTTS